VICGQGRVSVRALACPVFAYTSGREQNAKEKRKQAREILGSGDGSQGSELGYQRLNKTFVHGDREPR
jgi:hypothetical protein